jgi:hypothetical protein
MIPNKVLVNQSMPGSGQEPTNKQRRTFIGGALAALLASPGRAMAEEDTEVLNNPFILLLKGVYQPVPQGHGPNLGLSGVNLNDGTYSTTKIYAIFGVPGSTDQDNAVGKF